MGSRGGRVPCNWEMILFLKCPSLGFVKGRASVCLACECSRAQGTEPRGVSFWFSIQHDRQASSFILSEGTPGHTAFYCCDCSVDQATLDPQRGEPQDSFMLPSPSPFPFLACQKGPSLQLLWVFTLKPGAWVWRAWDNCSYFTLESLSFSGRWPGWDRPGDSWIQAMTLKELEFLARF